jgi:hypothetical protein
MGYTTVRKGITYIFEEELNDSNLRATPSTNFFAGGLSNLSDVDWFSVSLPANTLIRVQFASDNGQLGRWSTQFFDSKLNQAGAANFSISGVSGISSAETSFMTSGAGLYYFKVQAYDGNSFRSDIYFIGLDYVSPPKITAANSEITMIEGNTENPKVAVTLNFDKPTTSITFIHYTVRSGTANVGTLYGSDVIGTTSGNLLVEAGATSASLPTTLIWSDRNQESDEYFWVDFDSISIGNAQFAGGVSTLTVKVIIKDDDTPTYEVTANTQTVNENSNAVFTLKTSNVDAGTILNYQISGISVSDVLDGKLSGQVSVNSSGTTSISIPISGDAITEGPETLILTVQGKSANITILDTSVAPIVTNESHLLTVLVNKGVLGAEPVLLKNLAEKVILTNGTVTSHVVTYGGLNFEYDQIDPTITTVVRDGSFTSEFLKEIFDVAPSAANLSYKDAVELVGVNNIDSVIINIAGSDGNYVA